MFFLHLQTELKWKVSRCLCILLTASVSSCFLLLFFRRLKDFIYSYISLVSEQLKSCCTVTIMCSHTRNLSVSTENTENTVNKDENNFCIRRKLMKTHDKNHRRRESFCQWFWMCLIAAQLSAHVLQGWISRLPACRFSTSLLMSMFLEHTSSFRKKNIF